MTHHALKIGAVALLAAFALYFAIKYTSLIPSPLAGWEATGKGPQPAQRNSLGLDYFSKRQIGRPRGGRRGLMETLALCICPGCQTRFTRSGIVLDTSQLLNGVVLIGTMHLKDVQ